MINKQTQIEPSTDMQKPSLDSSKKEWKLWKNEIIYSEKNNTKQQFITLEEEKEFILVTKKKIEKNLLHVFEIQNNNKCLLSNTGKILVNDIRIMNTGHTIKEFIASMTIGDMTKILSNINNPVYSFVRSLFSKQGLKVLNKTHPIYEFIDNMYIQDLDNVFKSHNHPYHPFIDGLTSSDVYKIMNNQNHILYSCVEKDNWGVKFTFPRTEKELHFGKNIPTVNEKYSS